MKWRTFNNIQCEVSVEQINKYKKYVLNKNVRTNQFLYLFLNSNPFFAEIDRTRFTEYDNIPHVRSVIYRLETITDASFITQNIGDFI